MTNDAVPRNPQPRSLVLLRPVPGTSPVHSLWAGTKLIIVFAIGMLMTFYPGWVPIALVGVLVAMTFRLAHIPRGVLPSIPKVLWVLLLLGGVSAAFAGGVPVVQIGSVYLALGGLLTFLRITALSVVLLLLGGLVSWTTNVSEIAPALATLGRPLRRLRLPVDEWAVTVALALRAFPMLFDEFRLLFAARKLRPKPVLTTGSERRQFWRHELLDILTAGLVVMLRRGDEMGDAITARGGTGQIAAAPATPKAHDWIALAVLALLCAVVIVLEMTVFANSPVRL
ncbi:MAG TPA: energy-coupling factor transporter transmembrane protein EcfT [Mycobacterium sp.]|nr:energy-coupling factor transporter transmembrane protein EcfT [Mycobacterium sp.]